MPKKKKIQPTDDWKLLPDTWELLPDTWDINTGIWEILPWPEAQAPAVQINNQINEDNG
jgi:hypothetical protein